MNNNNNRQAGNLNRVNVHFRTLGSYAPIFTLVKIAIKGPGIKISNILILNTIITPVKTGYLSDWDMRDKEVRSLVFTWEYNCF